MQKVEALWENGEVILKVRPDWPEGSRLTVAPVTANGEDQSDDAEAIARWIAEFDAIPPVEMTPAEEAEWHAARQAQRQLERARSTDRADSLRGALE